MKPLFCKILFAFFLISFSSFAQYGTTVFEDHFDNNDKGWLMTSNDERNVKIVGGVLFLQNNNDRGYWTGHPVNVVNSSSNNYSLSVKTNHAGGVDDHGFGLAFATGDVNNAYMFLITKNKYFRITQYTDGTSTNICDWTKSDMIYGYLSNNLEVKQKDGNWEFYINGSKVYSTYARNPKGKYVGVWVYDKQTIEFDDFVVKDLSSSSYNSNNSYNSGSNNTGANRPSPSSPSNPSGNYNSDNNSNSNNTVDASSGDFNTDFKKILKSASNTFSDIQGDDMDPSKKYFKDYSTTIKLPGSSECKISNLLGKTYYAYYGPFSSSSAASAKMEELLGKVKNNVTGYYSMKKPNGENYQYVLGRSVSGGYKKSNISIYFYKDSKTYEYKTVLSLSSFDESTEKTYYYLTGSADKSSTFGRTFNKIMDAAPDSFYSLRDGEGIKGWLGTTYNANLLLPGADKATLSKFVYWSYNSTFYEGENESKANDVYRDLYNDIKKAVGSNYVICNEVNDGKGNLNYNLKVSKDAGSGMKDYPEITIYRNYSTYSKKYEVKISLSRDWGF